MGDNIAETDDTDNSDEYEAKPSADINSNSCPSECIVKKNICFTATVKVKEHLIFNLSNDEFDCPGLPWKKTDFHEYQNFSGFEEAGQDDINELTKVVTSHNLYIDVIDFKPMKIFLPHRPGK